MSIKSSGDSSLPPLKTTISSPQDGEALTYDATTGTWINGIQFTTVKPTITTPANGTILTSAVNTTFSSSTAFSVTPTNYLLTHYATDWQVASDSAFSNILVSTTLDQSNKTSWTAVVPAGAGTVYVRVRYHNGQEYGAWSNTQSYQVYQVYTYTSTQNITVPNTTNTMEINIVGGGSGAGPGSVDGVKGGSGGGVNRSANTAVTPGSTVLVTVGAGAAGRNTGGASSFGNLLSANGGTANLSGNGFGKGNNNTNDTANHKGGGGGGAGGAGNNANNRSGYGSSNGGNGGSGVTFNIDSTTRGGGGGGGATPSGNSLYGFGPGYGIHGGGDGSPGGGQSGSYTAIGNSGTNQYGGGGGGVAISATSTTSGGNGVVQVKYIS